MKEKENRDEERRIELAQMDGAMKAIGISTPTISERTARMLQIKQAINHLYGTFVNLFCEEFQYSLKEIELQDKLYDDYQKFDDFMWQRITQMMEEMNDYKDKIVL